MCVYLSSVAGVVCNRRGCCSSVEKMPRRAGIRMPPVQGGSAARRAMGDAASAAGIRHIRDARKCPTARRSIRSPCRRMQKQYPCRSGSVRNVVNIGLVNGGFRCGSAGLNTARHRHASVNSNDGFFCACICAQRQFHQHIALHIQRRAGSERVQIRAPIGQRQNGDGKLFAVKAAMSGLMPQC